jgi:type II secretory pathway pseudopilin PulG
MQIALIVVLAIVAVFLVLILVGALAATVRNRRNAERFSASLTAVDRALASATASDRGWERRTLDAAARTAFARERPGTRPRAFDLIQVVDEPGTDSDLAVYRVTTADGTTTRLTLGRREGDWYARSVEDER